MTSDIKIDGFTPDPDGSVWTKDGSWGLQRAANGELELRDSEGMLSCETLSDEFAADFFRHNHTSLDNWDYVATANR